MAVYELASVIGIEFEQKYVHLINKLNHFNATYKKQKTQKIRY